MTDDLTPLTTLARRHKRTTKTIERWCRAAGIELVNQNPFGQKRKLAINADDEPRLTAPVNRATPTVTQTSPTKRVTMSDALRRLAS